MPISAETFDGAIHEFPDGTQPDIIHKAMKNYTDRQMMVDPTTGMTFHQLSHAATVPIEAAKGIPILGAAVPDTADTKQFEKDQPALATASRGIGAALATAPAMMAAPELFGMSAAMSLPANMATAAVTGGLIGGADAAARGEPLASGAATGAITAGAAPVVGKALGAAFQGVMNRLTPSGKGALAGVDPKALDWASKAAKADGLTEEQIANMINTKGGDAFLAEYSPRLMGQAKGVAALPGGGEGKTGMIKAFEERGAPEAVKGRTTAAIDEALGPAINKNTSDLANESVRAAKADPLYTQWRATKIQPTGDLKKVVTDYEGLGLLNDAKRIAAEESAASGNAVEPMENFFTTGERKDWPTAKSYDYIKQAIDQRIAAAYKNGEPTQAVGRFIDMKKRLDSAIQNSNPQAAKIWNDAREAWGNPTAMINARDLGTKVWQPGTDVNELAHTLTNMTKPERDAFKEGARYQLERMMERSASGDKTVRNLLQGGDAANKMRWLANREGYNADKLINSVKREGEFAQNAKGLGATTEGLAQKEALEKMVANPADNPVHKFAEKYALHVRPADWIPKQGIFNFLQRRAEAKHEAARDALGNLLKNKGSEAQDIARALLNYTPSNARQAGMNTASVVRALQQPSAGNIPLPYLQNRNQ